METIFSVFVYSSEAGGMCEHIHGKLRAGFLQDAGPVADFIGFQQLAPGAPLSKRAVFSPAREA